MAAGSSYKAEITLPSDRELVVTRTFDAPRHLVYEAWTNAALVPRWWGCIIEGFTMPVCEMDVRVGGAYRWVMRGHGADHGFHGQYSELVPHAKIVMTQIYEPFPDEAMVVTLTFDERAGKTYFTSHTQYTSKQGRDGHIASGMEHGMNASFDMIEQIAREGAAAEHQPRVVLEQGALS